MRPVLITLAALCTVPGTPALAQTQATLRCQLDSRCDELVTRCSKDTLSLVVILDPAHSRVKVNTSVLEANYTHPAKVSFMHRGYTVDINRYDANILMYAPGEVWLGECSKAGVPW